MKEYLSALDPLNPNLGAGEMTIVNIILALVMFGVALGIKVQTFKDVFTNPKSLLVGVAMQWVVLPAITFLVALALNSVITPMIALGMILVASCPGGNISNFMSSYARGNVELSVSMTAITTVFAPFVTPINFLLWGSLYCDVVDLQKDIPSLEIPFAPMLEQIMLLLGIPIVLGIAFAHYFPNVTKRLLKPSQILSIVLFLGMVAVAFSNVVTSLEGGWSVALSIIFAFAVVVIHNASAFTTGDYGARLLRLSEKDCRSMTVEVGIQNSGLGLALLFNPAIFNPEIWNNNGGMIFIAALWGVWHIVAGLSVASIFRRKDRVK